MNSWPPPKNAAAWIVSRKYNFPPSKCSRSDVGSAKDGDRKFLLLVQVNVPDPEPVAGKTAGIDYGGAIPAATSDEHGNERLYRHSGRVREAER